MEFDLDFILEFDLDLRLRDDDDDDDDGGDGGDEIVIVDSIVLHLLIVLRSSFLPILMLFCYRRRGMQEMDTNSPLWIPFFVCLLLILVFVPASIDLLIIILYRGYNVLSL